MKKIDLLIMVGAMCFSLCACGENNKGNDPIVTPDTTTVASTDSQVSKDVKVADIEAAVATALGDNYFPNVEMDTLDSLEITADMYEEYIYKLPMIGANVDTLIIIKAKEGQIGNVEAKLNAFRDKNVNDLMQYPMNLTKIQCSQVTTFGDYAVLVQLGGGLGVDAVEAAMAKKELTDDEAAKIEMDAINEQNEMALDIIKNMLK